jgi:hypothetical protein
VNGADGFRQRLHVDRHLLDLVHELADLGDAPVAPGGLLQVVARAERAPLPGEDHDPHGRVAGGRLERLVQVTHQLGHHRVQPMRPVEADAGEAAPRVVQDRLERHGGSSGR